MAACTLQQLSWAIAVETTVPANIYYLVPYRKSLPAIQDGRMYKKVSSIPVTGDSEFLKND